MKYIRPIWIVTLIALGAFYVVDAAWYIIVASMLTTVIVNDVFVHRTCSHEMFELDVNSITYKILTFLSSIDLGFGPVLGATQDHRIHHIYSDQGKIDPMNWRHYIWGSALLLHFPYKIEVPNYKQYNKDQQVMFGHILNDPWTIFCSKYSILISMSVVTASFFFAPVVFQMIVIGRLALFISSFFALLGHIKSYPGAYRRYNLPDNTSNNVLLHYLFFGMFQGILHNNHHGVPAAMRPTSRWFEIDTSYPVVLLFKWLMEKR